MKFDFNLLISDGVGEGQFPICKEYELPQLKNACKLLDNSYEPNITFIIVQKRINTRIFKVNSLKFSTSVMKIRN